MFRGAGTANILPVASAPPPRTEAIHTIEPGSINASAIPTGAGGE